ncbi:MAG: DNA repair protein RadA [Candidatus Eisenbacteria bacterium]|nr:DNA repair protein RadA [Candidatus Eisenbacteria bacterium]
MAKKRTVFFCSSCGHESAKWLGKCPGCGEWNTFVEQRTAPSRRGGRPPSERRRPVPLGTIQAEEGERLVTGIGELDRALGGGIVPGGVVLVGGDPGIGKSTLLLQVSAALARSGESVLYVSGEESRSQLRLRARRLGIDSERILVLTETDVTAVLDEAAALEPGAVIVDSVQTVYHPDSNGSPGSVSQVREASSAFVRLAKEAGVPVFLIGHVTKQGSIAGPRILEHMVDTVLYFEGDKHLPYRIVRAVKNRFGSTDEIGVFEMTASGLTEVTDPSGLFLSEERNAGAGTAVVPCVEGTRAILVEVQALTGVTNYAVPQRSSTGVDRRRLPLLLAVLERKGGLSLGNRDVFVSVAGGVRVDEPAADLGIAVAVASSYRDRPVSERTVVFGELGLGGEVRRVTHAGKRVQEAARLGYERVIVPKGALPRDERPSGVDIVEVSTVRQALDAAVGSERTNRGASGAPVRTEV